MQKSRDAVILRYADKKQMATTTASEIRDHGAIMSFERERLSRKTTIQQFSISGRWEAVLEYIS